MNDLKVEVRQCTIRGERFLSEKDVINYLIQSRDTLTNEDIKTYLQKVIDILATQ